MLGAAAEALQVMPNQPPVAERLRKRLELRAIPLDQTLAVIAGPGCADDRQGDLALGEVLNRAPLGRDVKLFLDLPLWDEVRPQLVLEALEDHPELELAGDLAQPAPIHPR